MHQIRRVETAERFGCLFSHGCFTGLTRPGAPDKKTTIPHVTGHQLSIIQSKASLGLLALFDGEADLAMVAAPLNEAVALLRQTRPELPFHRLRSFPVLETRVAFPVNPDNPVRRVTLAKLKQVLSGQIDNWRELGGPDLPIHVISVTDGGGTRLTTQDALLDGQRIAARSEIRVAIPDDVVKAVAQDRGALGITQIALVRSPEWNGK